MGATIASLMMVLGALVVSSPAGAQEGPAPVVPGFCKPLSSLIDNGYGVMFDAEEASGQLDEGARLLAELRQVAPPELTEQLDAFEAFRSTLVTEVAAAGGFEALSESEFFALSDRLDAALEPIDTLYSQACPGANIQATLYPECESDDGIEPPFLEVGNFSDAPAEVTARDDVFTVEADDYDYRDVPADLRADEVLIDGVAGLVEEGSCDDFASGLFEDELSSLFSVTFTSGCPADNPPAPARLKVEFTDEGQAAIGAALDDEGFDDEGFDEEGFDEVLLGPPVLPIDVDGDLVLARFPAGFNLLLEADATVPEVKIFDVKLPVELREAKCSPAPPGGPVAAPLAPKFAG